VYKEVEREGRSCERLRIEKLMMVSSGGIEPATFDLLIQHFTTGPPEHFKLEFEEQ